MACSYLSFPLGTRTIDYKIDGENKRAIKKINGITVGGFIYDKNKRLVAELDSQMQVKSRLVYVSQIHVPDYMIEVATGNKYFFVKDHLGSILSVVNTQTGASVQDISYDEFGVVLSDSNPSFQPFGFVGGHYDHDTGLVRFGARDYNAELGRWLERDPIGFNGGQKNLWSYCGNDPVNSIDPSGLEPNYGRIIAMGLAGAAVGVGIAAAASLAVPSAIGLAVVGSAAGLVWGINIYGSIPELEKQIDNINTQPDSPSQSEPADSRSKQKIIPLNNTQKKCEIEEMTASRKFFDSLFGPSPTIELENPIANTASISPTNQREPSTQSEILIRPLNKGEGSSSGGSMRPSDLITDA